MRVNGISAGPIKTLAASGIKDFSKLLGLVARSAPLGRNVTIDDVGNVAAFLLSDLAAGVTAEITYVDGGFSHAMSGAVAELARDGGLPAAGRLSRLPEHSAAAVAAWSGLDDAVDVVSAGTRRGRCPPPPGRARRSRSPETRR